MFWLLAAPLTVNLLRPEDGGGGGPQVWLMAERGLWLGTDEAREVVKEGDTGTGSPAGAEDTVIWT